MDEVFQHIKTVSHDVTEIKRLLEFGKMKCYTVLKRDILAFLGVTKRGGDGFGSTSVSVIKKKKLELVSNEVSSEVNFLIISEKTYNQTQTISKEAIEETTSEKAKSNSEE